MTQASEEAAVVADLEAEAVSDGALILAFITANQASAGALQANTAALASQIADTLRAQQVQALADQMAQTIAALSALSASTTAAETAPPPA
jgi:hypothetical protein